MAYRRSSRRRSTRRTTGYRSRRPVRSRRTTRSRRRSTPQTVRIVIQQPQSLADTQGVFMTPDGQFAKPVAPKKKVTF